MVTMVLMPMFVAVQSGGDQVLLWSKQLPWRHRQRQTIATQEHTTQVGRQEQGQEETGRLQ